MKLEGEINNGLELITYLDTMTNNFLIRWLQISKIKLKWYIVLNF